MSHIVHLRRLALVVKLIIETRAKGPCQVNPVMCVVYALPARCCRWWCHPP